MSEPDEDMDPANWDCCDEHETVFRKGDECPKCEPEPEVNMTKLVDQLRGGWGDANEVCLAAADEIERLQTELRRVKSALVRHGVGEMVPANHPSNLAHEPCPPQRMSDEKAADCLRTLGFREPAVEAIVGTPPLAHNHEVRREIDGKHDVPDSQYAGILAAAESGDAVNTGDLINALWWRMGNQRRELGKKNADLALLAKAGCKVRADSDGHRFVEIASDIQE